MSFADRLKDARRSCGLSQEELAEQLDVSRQAVGKWEQGQAYPEVEKLLTLCAVLNTSLDALMTDELPKSCRTEINAIREAMRRGEADYTLQYNAKVRRRLGRIEIEE